MAQKFLIMSTVGPEDPERCTIPFSLAVTAQASDLNVVIGLQKDAVRLACKGGTEGIAVLGMPPLSDLLDAYVEAGGSLLVCTPCLASRGILAETLIPGAMIAGGATFIAECVDADKVLTY